MGDQSHKTGTNLATWLCNVKGRSRTPLPTHELSWSTSPIRMMSLEDIIGSAEMRTSVRAQRMNASPPSIGTASLIAHWAGGARRARLMNDGSGASSAGEYWC